MSGIIGMIMLAIPGIVFWIYTETPKGKKWIDSL